MNTLRHTLAQAAALMGLWAAAACNDGGDELPSSHQAAVVTPSAVEGRLFALESAEGFSVVSGTEVFLMFGNGELTLNAGCNAQSGRYELRDGRVIVPELGSTTKACSVALEAQDEWLAKFVAKQPLISTSGTHITLDAESEVLVFVVRADASTPGTGVGVGVSTPR